MANSQQFIPLQSVDQDYIFLEDGSIGVILSVSAVNFALLFETEQISIINSFAGMLNSLSFPIQIVIHSKIMDVSSYLQTVDRALAKQTNPLLRKLTLEYRSFVEKSIKDNNVLDKQFYVCIKATLLEIGLLPSNLTEKIHKATIVLGPRRDHLIKQLNRLGLKSKQLNSEEIIKLFYDIYNPPINVSAVDKIVPEENYSPKKAEPAPTPVPLKLRPIRTDLNQQPAKPIQPVQQIKQVQAIQPPPVIQPAIPNPPLNIPPAPLAPQTETSQIRLSSPFVVEELPDES